MLKANKVHVIRKEGGSRIVAVTKIIPTTWNIVSIVPINETKDSVTIRIDKVV